MREAPTTQPGHAGSTVSITPGAVLHGRYVVQGVLGSGGMGTVYLAHDNRLAGRAVALKELAVGRLPPADRAWRLQAFQSELQVLAGLAHPGLAAVTDFIDLGTSAFLVMEYVPGETLEELLARAPDGRLPEAQALNIVSPTRPSARPPARPNPPAPMIFRDLKPGNVMLQPDPATGGYRVRADRLWHRPLFQVGPDAGHPDAGHPRLRGARAVRRTGRPTSSRTSTAWGCCCTNSSPGSIPANCCRRHLHCAQAHVCRPRRRTSWGSWSRRR